MSPPIMSPPMVGCKTAAIDTPSLPSFYIPHSNSVNSSPMLPGLDIIPNSTISSSNSDKDFASLVATTLAPQSPLAAQNSTISSASQPLDVSSVKIEPSDSTSFVSSTKAISNGNILLLSCTMCDKKFATNELLKRHMKSHGGVSCHLCTIIFKDRLTLAKHQVEVHTSDRTYPCSQCDKTFKETRTLRLHLKIHNSEYPEQCGVCNKVFRTKWQLKQHLMDHGGSRPYPCPECSFTCKTKQQLNEHRRKHSGEKAYSCPQCGTRFTYRNGLIKHTKLNRCPKKIVTAEGETIIKKRSRIIAKFPPLSSPQSGQTSGEVKPVISNSKTEKCTLDAKILDALQRRGLSNNGLTTSSKSTIVTSIGGVSPVCVGQGSFSGGGGLLDGSTDISSWASMLPAGTKVTVTHYDASKKAGEGGELVATPTHTETILVTDNMVGPNLQQRRLMLSRGSQPLPSLAANNSLPALNCLPTSSPPTMISSQPCNQPSEISNPPPCGMELGGENDIKPVSVFSSLPHGGIAMPTLLAQSVSGLKPVPLSALQTTNISHSQEALNLFSSIGVANYTEYTAVDPNEILSQERHIKSEPTTPNINSLNKSPLTLINPNRQFATQNKIKSEPTSPPLSPKMEPFYTQISRNVSYACSSASPTATSSNVSSTCSTASPATISRNVSFPCSIASSNALVVPQSNIISTHNQGSVLSKMDMTAPTPLNMDVLSQLFDQPLHNKINDSIKSEVEDDHEMCYSHELSTKNNSLITNDNIASHATDNLVKQDVFIPDLNMMVSGSDLGTNGTMQNISVTSNPFEIKVKTEGWTEVGVTPLASPDSGYGESSCHLTGQICTPQNNNKTSYDWLKVDQDEEMMDILESNNHQATKEVHPRRRKSWFSDLEVDFNALIKEIDENSSSVDFSDRCVDSVKQESQLADILSSV